MNGSFYEVVLWPFEKFELSKQRKKLLSKSKGKTLEIGAGTGLNFPHYPAETQVIATDPDESMLKKAKSKNGGQHIQIRSADAESLPFDNDQFDTVVATLVFCTIPDPDQGLSEVYRVLRPGGRFLLLEHVRRNTPLAGKALDALTPLWKRMAGGCHLNRDPSAKIEELGFEVIDHQIIWDGFGKIWVLKK